MIDLYFILINKVVIIFVELPRNQEKQKKKK